MKSNISGFERLGSLVRKHHRWIILGWIIVFLISLTMISGFLSSVNYNITSSSGPTNTESQKAQNIINAEFSAVANNTGSNSIEILLQGIQPYSDTMKNEMFALNRTLTADDKISNYTGMSSLYAQEYTGLNGFIPSLLPEVSEEVENITDSGQNVSYSQAWSIASTYVANAAVGAFYGNPFFSINSTSLALLLSNLSENSTMPQIESATLSVVSNQSFSDYPLVPTQAILQDYVSPNNETELFTLNFASSPTTQTISQISDAINDSGLKDLGAVYVTGLEPITQDVESSIAPALVVTVGVAIVASLLIVGFMFLAPLAAFVPLLMGGLSITIAFGAVYIGLVKIGHQSLSFLTPTTTSLLMLGLTVDYSVLQMRRTREERLKGRTVGESVDVSVKWAGQAVLTAGITVIIAYVIMAIANVPLISTVGAAIAIGVSVLLLMSLTLLPSLESALGDKLFWPRMNGGLLSARTQKGKSRLERVAEGTLNKKVAVIGIISVIAVGAFITYYETPTGQDLLNLLPNFPSIQGVTVLTNSFGIGSVEIVVTTPTPIVYGADQFNQTLMNDIQEISSSALNSSGVFSVASPTMPLGVNYDYETLGNMPAIIRTQYESEMLSLVGQNNETALIRISLSESEMSAAAVKSLQGLKENIRKLDLPSDLQVYYGGATEQTYDSASFLNGVLPEIVLILAAAIYVILFIQLRSAFTPIRLIFTILCSVAFSLAILSIVFSHALNSPIIDLAPLFAIVTMLGVGIDYDIFFVTRIKEEVMSGKTDNEAIKTAIGKMWLTILGMGLVLFCVFGSDGITGIPLLQQIGLTVAAALIVDTTIVILFFVPSLMGLAQDFNWWPSKIAMRNKSRLAELSEGPSDH